MNPNKIPETPAARDFRLFMEKQGHKRGLAEGEARGEARGKQGALLMLLRARGLSPTKEDEARIRACTSAAKLDRWIERAATASSVTEALGARAAAAPARKRGVSRAAGVAR
ncbi:MAG: hypothetical protein U0359_42575 [Byssovorax sp.]